MGTKNQSASSATRQRNFIIGSDDLPSMDELLDPSLEAELCAARERNATAGDAIAIFATDYA